MMSDMMDKSDKVAKRKKKIKGGALEVGQPLIWKTLS